MKAGLMKCKNLNAVCFGLIAFLAVIITCPAAWAANYYVDNKSSNASDSNSGTQAQPWKTIQNAANKMVAGDVVYVKAGTYNESIKITRSGSNESSRITFAAYPGDKPIIDGTGKVSNWKGIFYSGSTNLNYITIDGFVIRNTTEYGIRIDYCNYWVIKNCDIYNEDNGGFVGIRSNNTLIQNCNVHDTGWNGLSILGGGGNIFEHNYIYDNVSHCGFQFITDHSNGDTSFYSGNIGRYNRVTGNHTGSYFRNQKDMKLYGNFFYNNTANSGYAGIFMDSGDGTSTSFDSNSEIYNNTIVGHPKSIANTSHRKVSYWNNIFYNPSSEPLRLTGGGASGQVIDYNCYYGKDYSGKGSHGFYADPLFLDASKNDYNVRSNSPTLGTGKNGADIGAQALVAQQDPSSDLQLASPKNLRVNLSVN